MPATRIAPQHDAPPCACGGPLTPSFGGEPQDCPDHRLNVLICVSCGQERTGTNKEAVHAWWSQGAYCQRQHDDEAAKREPEWAARIAALAHVPAGERAAAVRRLCRDFELVLDAAPHKQPPLPGVIRPHVEQALETGDTGRALRLVAQRLDEVVAERTGDPCPK